MYTTNRRLSVPWCRSWDACLEFPRLFKNGTCLHFSILPTGKTKISTGSRWGAPCPTPHTAVVSVFSPGLQGVRFQKNFRGNAHDSRRTEFSLQGLQQHHLFIIKIGFYTVQHVLYPSTTCTWTDSFRSSSPTHGSQLATANLVSRLPVSRTRVDFASRSAMANHPPRGSACSPAWRTRSSCCTPLRRRWGSLPC